MADTKNKLAEMLENNEGEYLSGEVLAENLAITRAAVWKHIRQLEEDGYRIEAISRKGYRLSDANDVVSANKIKQYLGEKAEIFHIEVVPKIESTNNALKECAKEKPEWCALIARQQTGGRGRRGHTFFSPADTGVYISILMKQPISAEEAVSYTTASAVAACRAIEKCTSSQPAIKWVNDIYVDGKKVCGILTEASLSMESGLVDWAVMGIGFNVYEPENGFPEEIKDRAGCISDTRRKDLKSRLMAAFITEFYLLCQNLNSKDLVNEYKSRSFIVGKPILIFRGNESIPAFAEDIDEKCRLIVRYEDGRTESLSSGEISVMGL